MSPSLSAPPGDCAAHIHVFDDGNPLAERRMRIVAGMTAAMMVVEITAGWWFHSMALLADGWHMSSHALALGLSAAAYSFARRLATDERFAFGTWKVEVLGGYTSAVFLVGVCAYMVYESTSRLSHPAAIAYDQALLIACAGLLVNVLSAWLLGTAAHGHHEHPHDHMHGQGRHHSHEPSAAGSPHHDLNLRSAYLHVAADAATSVLAIGALAGGKLFGLGWLDPLMGYIGAAVVAAWAVNLLRDTARVLLDAEMDAPVVEEIRAAVRAGPIPARIQDLHVWRVARNKYACLLVVGCGAPGGRERELAPPTPEYFRDLLSIHEELVHVTVEINRLADAGPS